MFKLLGVVVISAVSVGLSYGTPCAAGTAASYVALGAGGCTIDVAGQTLLFNNFSFMQNVTGSVVGGSATLINLTPVVIGNTAGFDITPIGAFSAGLTAVNDVELVFVASAVGGASIINGLNDSITGSAGASNVGGGLAGSDTLLEDFCRGGSLPAGSCPAGLGGTLVDLRCITGAATDSTSSHNNTFTPTNALSVLKDIAVTGNNGGASVSDVKDLVSVVVPEPTIGLLFGMALCGLGLVRRVRKSA